MEAPVHDDKRDPTLGRAAGSSPSTYDGELAGWDCDIKRAARHRARLLDCEADAEDFAQEARIRLLLVTRRLGPRPEGYSRTVIANAIRATARRERAQGNRVPLEEDIPSVGASPEDVYGIRAVTRWVERLPSSLNAIYRVLYRDQRSQRQAGRILGISQPRVAQLHRELLDRGRVELRHVSQSEAA
jgi:RNA polymerase sigma factor (sigma-70 family)